jgi:selenide,water dikinase
MSGRKQRLTDFANCAGCAGKLSSQGVAQILSALPARSNDPNLLVGTETCDDAGVYRESGK